MTASRNSSGWTAKPPINAASSRMIASVSSISASFPARGITRPSPAACGTTPAPPAEASTPGLNPRERSRRWVVLDRTPTAKEEAMEAEQRPQDKEPGTPQEELEDEKVPNEEREDRPQGDVGAP